MDLKYRWKNGAPPSREEALKNESLLDEGQFETSEDRKLAEEEVRKHLGVPTHVENELSVLPRAVPPGDTLK